MPRRPRPPRPPVKPLAIRPSSRWTRKKRARSSTGGNSWERNCTSRGLTAQPLLQPSRGSYHWADLAQPRGIDLGLSAGTQQGIFGHQPLSLAHLVAGSITVHLAIGGVREGAIMLGIEIALGSRCPPARLAMQAPVAGLPAFVGTDLGIGPGGLEGSLALDASHVMPR